MSTDQKSKKNQLLCDCGHNRKDHSRKGEWCRGEEGVWPCFCGGWCPVEGVEDAEAVE